MKRLLLAVTTVAGITASLPAAAQFQKPEDAIKYRQSAMFVMANHVGRIGAMVNGKAPYDAAQAAANADVVATMSKLPYIGFIEGTPGTIKGSASPKIWTDRATFDERARKMQDAVANMAVVSKSNNLDQLKAAFDPVGKACKSCHDDFRNP